MQDRERANKNLILCFSKITTSIGKKQYERIIIAAYIEGEIGRLISPLNGNLKLRRGNLAPHGW